MTYSGKRPMSHGARALIRAAGSVAAIALLGLPVGSAEAQTTWTGGVSDDWFTPGNWSTGIPDVTDPAFINQEPRPVIETGGSAIAQTVTVGNAGGDGRLSISNGTLGTFLDSVIGETLGSNGEVIIGGPDATWATNTAGIRVGFNGAGQLSVLSRGSLDVGELAVGYHGTGEGDVTVDGLGSIISSGFLILGFSGDGVMAIRNGAVVNSSSGSLGATGSSDGRATVTGAGSAWTMTGDLVVGRAGAGLLSVLDGARVTSVNTTIGNLSGSNGSAIVSGAGSTWTSGAQMVVGNDGSGTLTVADGGRVVIENDAAMVLANGGAVTGTLNIGAAEGDTAALPGTVDAASVDFGAGTGTLVFNHSGQDYSFAPDITGGGTIRFLSGQTRLTGDSSGFTGATTVSGGELIADGVFGGTTSFGDGSRVSGTGRLGSAVLASGATIAPGNSVGTLTFDGDLTFSSGTVYEVEVDRSGADRVNVNGDAALAGRVAVISLEPDNDRSILGDYVILNATGNMTGSFDGGVTANYAFLIPTLNQGENSVTLTLAAVPAPDPEPGHEPGPGPEPEPEPELVDIQRLLSPFAQSGNAVRLVSVLDSLDRSAPGYTAFENAVLLLLRGQETAAVQGLAGSSIAAMDGAIPDAARRFQSSIQAHNTTRTRTGQPAGRSLAGSVGDVQYAALGGTAAAHPLPDQAGAAPATWARLVGSQSDLGDRGDRPGVEARFAGLHAGVEAPLADGFVVGAALGFERGTLKAGRLGVDDVGRADVDVFSGGLYARHSLDDLRFAASAGYTHLTLDSQRDVVGFGRQEASYDAGVWSLDAEAAYDISLSAATTVSPLAGLSFAHSHRDGFSETGTAGLDVRSMSETSARSRIGAALSVDLDDVALSAQAAWSRELANPGGSTEASLLGSRDYRLAGQRLPDDMVEIGVGVRWAPQENVELFAAYDGTLADRYASHAGQLGLRVSW